VSQGDVRCLCVLILRYAETAALAGTFKDMTKTIALFSIKGGVGKTASAVNLAALSSLHGRRTLIWDLDPQGASTWYLRTAALDGVSLKKLLKGKKLGKTLRKTPHRNLWLLPSDPVYRDMERTLDEMKHGEFQIARMLEELHDEFDEIWIDCPPGMSLLADNILRAAEILLVPMIPTHLSQRTWQQLSEHMDRERIHPRHVHAFLTMVDRRRVLHRDFLAQQQGHIKGLWEVEIPYASAVEQMGVDRMPTVFSQPRSPAAQAYFELWKKIDALIDD